MANRKKATTKKKPAAKNQAQVRKKAAKPAAVKKPAAAPKKKPAAAPKKKPAAKRKPIELVAAVAPNMPTETDDQLKHYRALIQSASHIEALRIRAAKLHDKKSEVSRECTEADRMYIDAIQDHQDLMYGRGEHAQGKLDFDGGAQPDRWQDHPITALGLTSKLEDVLVKGGITTIGPLESCVKGGRNWPTGVGKVGEEEIVEAFEAYWADNPGIQRQLDEESGDS